MGSSNDPNQHKHKKKQQTCFCKNLMLQQYHECLPGTVRTGKFYCTYDTLKEETVKVNLKQDRVRCFQMKPPQFGMWGGGSQGVIGQKDRQN